MNDLEKLLRDAQNYQQQTGTELPPAPRRGPLILSAGLALFLVLVSLGIHVFWPLPQKKPLIPCDRQVSASCRNGATEAAPRTR